MTKPAPTPPHRFLDLINLPQGRDLPAGRSSSEGDIWVVGISKGSAADLAGLEQGDQLVSVDGKSMGGGITPFQASALIAGPGDDETPSTSGSSDGSGSGTPQSTPVNEVALTVRKAGGRVERYNVPRPAQQLASPVRYALQSRGGGRKVGVVSIKSFTARAQRDVAAAIHELQERGAQELELDLRDNRWGTVGSWVPMPKPPRLQNAHVHGFTHPVTHSPTHPPPTHPPT